MGEPRPLHSAKSRLQCEHHSEPKCTGSHPGSLAAWGPGTGAAASACSQSLLNLNPNAGTRSSAKKKTDSPDSDKHKLELLCQLPVRGMDFVPTIFTTSASGGIMMGPGEPHWQPELQPERQYRD